MDPLEQIQTVRNELQRLAGESAARDTPEMQEKLAQLQSQLGAAEQRLRESLAQVAPTKAAVRAEGDELVRQKMARAEEIKALKKEHGAAWVFVPSAKEQAAAAVPPIEEAEVPDMVASMFEQLKIQAGASTHAGDATDDREIWEDLSQMESSGPGAPAPALPTPPPAAKPGKANPRKGDGEIWEDFSQLGEN